MKRIISVFLMLSIFSALLVPLNPFALAEETAIQSFIDDSINLINRTPDNNIVLNSGETTETNSEFETCRLVIQADKKPNKLNSLGIASGFEDFYIVQFGNATDTEIAYNYYLKQDSITNISIDKYCNVFGSITFNSADEDDMVPNVTSDRLNSWGSDATGLYALKDYVISHNTPLDEIVVAVIDSGVDLDHEFLSGRLIETGFNSSISGETDSEQDNFGHGTAVTSVIVDSTPDNVKVANYKVGEVEENNKETVTPVTVTAAVLQAVQDDVDVISASLTFSFDGEEDANYALLKSALEKANEANISVTAAAGNYADDLEFGFYLPANLTFVITATSCGYSTAPSGFSNRGIGCADISAPGEFITTASLNNSYNFSSGTSLSTPLTASVCAMVKALNSELSAQDIKDIIKETATPFDEHFVFTEPFGVGILNAVDASGLKRQNSVSSNYPSGKHIGEMAVELTSEGSSEIYYTLDGSVPSKSNGTLYKEPIRIYGDNYALKAVAYNGNDLPSRVMSKIYRSAVMGKEEDFEIDEKGRILSYNGNIHELIIPETVNQITVTDIGYRAFSESEIYGVTLPKTITKLTNGFTQSNNIMFVDGESVKEIGEQVFANSSIMFANFPNVETVGYRAFYGVLSLRAVSFPKCTKIGTECFESSSISRIYMPELTSCGMSAFKSCRGLYELIIPKTTEFYIKPLHTSCAFRWSFIREALDLPCVETVHKSVFYVEPDEYTYFKRIEFSNLKTMNSAPYHPTTLVLPATLTEITVAKESMPYAHTIYGSKGTLAEQWAIENGFEFIEITPETAVITDLPEYYKSYMGELEADVVGFNRQYQWYANSIDSNEGGTPIEGATNKAFNPSDYPAPYYYCVVTSTDKGFDPVIIKTSACENRAAVADYSKVNEALAKVPTDLSKYTAESRLNLENAVNAVAWNLNISDQSQVDAMAKVIEEAVTALELMPVDVSMVEAVIQMTCGESRKLTVVCDEKVTFESSDTSVATVDENGVVTAVGKGTATITAASSNETDTCIVEVKFTFCQLIMYWFNIIVSFIVNCILSVG